MQTLDLLSTEEFEAHIAQGTLRLAFVGMSNAGKSYRSKTLASEKNFLWYQVDEAIQRDLGFETMGEISSWLGFPTSPEYKDREAKYLELENKATLHASMQTEGKNLVFDTTGSVIHLSDETLQSLRENCLIIHLDVGDDSLSSLIEKFFTEPKPVCWAGHFTKREGESDRDALARSYPELLKERLFQYRALAHINIPARLLYDTSGADTLTLIRERL